MATALAIITDAMVEIGAYAPGTTIAAVHQQLGLTRFQNQLDSWQSDELSLNVQDRLTFSLLAGVRTFTIGPSGDLIAVRPTYIDGVNYIIPGVSPDTEVPMAPLNADQYMAIAQKRLTSSLPTQYYYNQDATNGTMIIWPITTQTVTLAIYVEHGISIPATINTSVVGPQGYAEAFMYQLALRLCGPMARPIPPALPTMAREAYARMQRPNVDPGMLGMDQALVSASDGAGAFNVLTGTFSGSSSGR